MWLEFHGKISQDSVGNGIKVNINKESLFEPKRDSLHIKIKSNNSLYLFERISQVLALQEMLIEAPQPYQFGASSSYPLSAFLTIYVYG